MSYRIAGIDVACQRRSRELEAERSPSGREILKGVSRRGIQQMVTDASAVPIL
jgi:hypothetical protein